MPKILVSEDETLDESLQRFKRSVNKSGILYDASRHVAFYPKSLRRKMKSEKNRYRNR